MLYFIKLTRPVNLLVILLTMYVMHGLFIQQSQYGLVHTLVFDINFAMLTFSTVLIAAAGNIINDYFDVKIDRINKPEKLIVDKWIKKRVAILFHSVINVIAFVFSLIVWLNSGFYIAILFHLFTTFHLYLYSMLLKRKFLSGNVVISLITASLPVLVYFFDLNIYGFSNQVNHNLAFQIMAYFTLFAFCTTLIREIQKDFADMKGDALYGCKTVPIWLGLRKGRIILFFIFAFTIVVFCVLSLLMMKYAVINFTFFIVITLLLLLSFYFSFKAIKRKQWIIASSIMKSVMIVALIFFAIKLFYA